MSDNKYDTKSLGSTFHILFDEEGKLRPIKSFINKKGQKVYYMERPQPVESPKDSVCSFHVYELVRGFIHDTYKCKFCGEKQEK